MNPDNCGSILRGQKISKLRNKRRGPFSIVESGFVSQNSDCHVKHLGKRRWRSLFNANYFNGTIFFYSVKKGIGVPRDPISQVPQINIAN